MQRKISGIEEKLDIICLERNERTRDVSEAERKEYTLWPISD